MDIEEFPHLLAIDLSDHFKQQFVHLFFNITRKTSDIVIQDLALQFRELLLLLKQEMVNHRSNGFLDTDFKGI